MIDFKNMRFWDFEIEKLEILRLWDCESIDWKKIVGCWDCNIVWDLEIVGCWCAYVRRLGEYEIIWFVFIV